MASYSKVSASFWRDPRVRTWIAAGDERSVTLALYVHTCDHSNAEGLYWLPKAYVSADLNWKPAEVSKRIKTLTGAEYIEYDHSAEVVFVCNALELHSPGSPPQIQGALKALDHVPPTPLFTSLVSAAEQHAERFAQALGEHFDGGLPTLTPTVT